MQKDFNIFKAVKKSEIFLDHEIVNFVRPLKIFDFQASKSMIFESYNHVHNSKTLKNPDNGLNNFSRLV